MLPGSQTGRSSYLEEGKRHAHAREAEVDRHQVIWIQALPEDMLEQKVELITKALELGKGKILNKNSRYTFATAHVHGHISMEGSTDIRRKRN